MKISLQFVLVACAASLLGLALAERANAGETPSLHLQSEAQVDGQGIYLDQVVSSAQPFHIRLADSPAFGGALVLTRSQVIQLIEKNASHLATTNWEGANGIKITRQSRTLQEEELLGWVAAAVQHDAPQNWGQLELRLTRPWTTLAVPTEPVVLKILDMPVAGISPSCIIRFEMRCGSDLLGTWSIPVQAHLWREVWVAQSNLHRGDSLLAVNFTKEKRDALVLREAFQGTTMDDASWELAENLAAGTPLMAHSVRMRPMVTRGNIVDAVVQDGTMVITAKVQALEDGLLGQSIRVRNIKSGREFRGKVQNEQSIQVSL